MKCKICEQRFLKDVKKLSKTKKTIMSKVCTNCRILPSNRNFREKRK